MSSMSEQLELGNELARELKLELHEELLLK